MGENGADSPIGEKCNGDSHEEASEEVLVQPKIDEPEELADSPGSSVGLEEKENVEEIVGEENEEEKDEQNEIEESDKEQNSEECDNSSPVVNGEPHIEDESNKDNDGGEKDSVEN